MPQVADFFGKIFNVAGWYANRVLFVGIHVLVLSVFFVPCSAVDIWLCVGFYCVGMFGISAGYHRLLSHQSYGANRWMRFFLSCLGSSALQKGPIWWTKQHRDHHKYTDNKEDPHSPMPLSWRNLFHAHIGWIFHKRKGENDFSSVKDLTGYWELRMLDRFHFVPAFLLLYLCYVLGGLSTMAWGFVVRTVILYHTTFMVNSICHWPWFGSRQFNTPDASRNNFAVAIITLGEGWHNDHHHQQGRAKQGIGWWKVDISYYLLWLLWAVSFGYLVWGLRKPSHKVAKVAA